eukprot:scaffold12603_cov60-Attheya_sp.AAC.2
MLLAAKSAPSHCDADAMRRLLPRRLYQSSASSTVGDTTIMAAALSSPYSGKNRATIIESSSECVVCLTNTANAIPVPCGHIACCNVCLRKIRRKRDGCPICRARIVAIVLQ